MGKQAVALVEKEAPEETPADETYKIRPIVARDLFTVIKVVVPKLDMNRIRQIFTDMREMTEQERSAAQSAVGMEVITMLLNVVVENDVQQWLADLIGKTHEQLLDMPVDAPFRIAQALWQDEDMRRIFTTLLQ